jgi:hypothetical protein
MKSKTSIVCSTFSAYPSALKMAVTCSSEVSVEFQPTACRYIPEDKTLHYHRCENLRSYIQETGYQDVDSICLAHNREGYVFKLSN